LRRKYEIFHFFVVLLDDLFSTFGSSYFISSFIEDFLDDTTDASTFLAVVLGFAPPFDF